MERGAGTANGTFLPEPDRGVGIILPVTAPTDLDDQTEGGRTWASWTERGVTPLAGPAAWVGLGLFAVVLVVGVWLRFATTSLLWLDEALSVNIAKLPVGEIPGALKRDGAPPLYYVLLHFWIRLFGDSDAAVRSLSGICSLLALVGLFFLVRRIWGAETAFIATGILAASAFASYYATESRMYALVMLLVVLLGWAIALLVERPSFLRALGLALMGAALLYTHYWSFFLLGALGAWFALMAIRGGGVRRAGALGLGGLAVAGLTFVPWLSIFSFQSAHTGTPWAKTPDLQIALTGILHFYDNQGALPTAAGPSLSLLELYTVALVVLAVFGVAKGRRRIMVDLAGRSKGRFLAWIVFGTLVLGIVGAHVSKSTFVPRYASVIFVPLVIMMAVGTQAIGARWIRLAVISVLAVTLLTQGLEWRTTQRSQAGQVVRVLEAQAKPGDFVLFCPDQLGPSVLRELPASTGLRPLAYPRIDDPRFINWVDYLDAIKSMTPSRFVNEIAHRVKGHSVWLVWSTGYGPYQSTCSFVASTFLNRPGWGGHQWVNAHPYVYFQSMNLTQFNPPDRPARSSGSR
jgi:hypothetical protein